jgi:DNA-binding CsgD family transcriptional regulator
MADTVRTVSPLSGGLDDDAWAGELGHLLRPCGCTLFNLTSRELDVLEQLAEGKSTITVARSLFVSHQAVTYHVGNLLAKFQCTNRTGLVSCAFVLGILDCKWPPRVARRPKDARHSARRCGHRLKELQRRRTHIEW